MVSYDNSGTKIGEINVIIRPGEGVVTANTVYSGARIITQNISNRDKCWRPGLWFDIPRCDSLAQTRWQPKSSH